MAKRISGTGAALAAGASDTVDALSCSGTRASTPAAGPNAQALEIAS